MALFNTTLEAMKDQIVHLHHHQAEAVRLGTEVTRWSQEEKGPTDNKFACLGNNPSENFTAWYNNVLSKLSTASWCKLYNTIITNNITDTMEETYSLSNHFYSSIRNAFYGDALDLMDNKTSEYRGLGVEFFQAMIPIYCPQWPTTERMKKQREFYNMFHCSEEG
eukprot:14947531-Ditylum_brightwellii.AAC.1